MKCHSRLIGLASAINTCDEETAKKAWKRLNLAYSKFDLSSVYPFYALIGSKKYNANPGALVGNSIRYHKSGHKDLYHAVSDFKYQVSKKIVWILNGDMCRADISFRSGVTGQGLLALPICLVHQKGIHAVKHIATRMDLASMFRMHFTNGVNAKQGLLEVDVRKKRSLQELVEYTTS